MSDFNANGTELSLFSEVKDRLAKQGELSELLPVYLYGIDMFSPKGAKLKTEELLDRLLQKQSQGEANLITSDVFHTVILNHFKSVMHELTMEELLKQIHFRRINYDLMQEMTAEFIHNNLTITVDGKNSKVSFTTKTSDGIEPVTPKRQAELVGCIDSFIKTAEFDLMSRSMKLFQFY